MNASRLILRLFLDEGVPVAVADVLREHGHTVLPFFDTAIQRGSNDTLVCLAADLNNAILVAYDNDMREAAKKQGIGKSRFKKLHIVKFDCPEPVAAERLRSVMSFIEHEWAQVVDGKSALLRVEISTAVIRSWR